MRSNKGFLAIILTVSGVISACSATATVGGGQAENKKAEPVKTAEVENKKAMQPAPTPQEELVNIIDGREERVEKEGTEAETQLVNKEFQRNKEAIYNSNSINCIDSSENEDVVVIGTAEGSFTKPDSSQKVFLYERCRAGRSFGIGGILITEDGKAVSHYSYGENGLDVGVFSLPDVNKNGLSEIVIVAGGSGQGYLNSAIYLWEMKDGKMNYLGNTAIYDDNSGAMEDEKKVETNAYKISVQPGANPIFYREHYQQKGGAKKWSLLKKAEKFSLDKGDTGKYVKIS